MGWAEKGFPNGLILRPFLPAAEGLYEAMAERENGFPYSGESLPTPSPFLSDSYALKFATALETRLRGVGERFFDTARQIQASASTLSFPENFCWDYDGGTWQTAVLPQGETLLQPIRLQLRQALWAVQRMRLLNSMTYRMNGIKITQHRLYKYFPQGVTDFSAACLECLDNPDEHTVGHALLFDQHGMERSGRNVYVYYFEMSPVWIGEEPMWYVGEGKYPVQPTNQSYIIRGVAARNGTAVYCNESGSLSDGKLPRPSILPEIRQMATDVSPTATRDIFNLGRWYLFLNHETIYNYKEETP